MKFTVNMLLNLICIGQLSSFRQDHGFDPPCGFHQLPVFLIKSELTFIRQAAVTVFTRWHSTGRHC